MVVISLGAQTHRPLGLDELSRLIPGVGISAEMTSVFGLVIVFKERFEVFLLHPQILSGFQDGARDRARANARLCP